MLSLGSSGRYDHDLKLVVCFDDYPDSRFRSMAPIELWFPFANIWWVSFGVKCFLILLVSICVLVYSGIGRMYVTLSMGVALEPPGYEGVLYRSALNPIPQQ